MIKKIFTIIISIYYVFLSNFCYAFEQEAPKTYNFEETHYSQSGTYTSSENTDILKGHVIKSGKGTKLQVYLQSPINTATANIGDVVVAVLKENWINKNYIIASQGSVLTGTLTDVKHARRGMRNGGVQIDFNKLETPNGKIYDLTTEKIDFDVTDDGRLTKTATSVAAATAIGALAGLAIAFLGGRDHYVSRAAIGAGVAGGVALISNVAQKGVDAEIPSYTELEVLVEKDISIVVNY